jgi:hypothetical protein
MNLTTEDLIQAATRWGYPVTSRQLERWRNAGVLPKMSRHGRGKGRGALWVYPPEATGVLRTFLEIRQPHEVLAETAVRMWLRTDENPSPILRKQFRAASTTHRSLRRKFARTSPRDYGEALAETAQRRPAARGPFGDAKFDQTAVDQVRDLGEALGMAFVQTGKPVTPEGQSAMKRALQVTPAEEAVVDMLGADLPDLISAALPRMAGGDEALESATDAELLEARTLFRVTEHIAELGKQMPPEHPVRALLQRTESLGDGTAALMASLQTTRWVRESSKDALAESDIVIESLEKVVHQGQVSA